MARLREVLERAGFAHVRTYIQSGNALVDSELPAQEVETTVHGIIRSQMGADLAIIVRTGAELEEALERNPYTDGHDLSRVFFVSLARPPPEDKTTELLSWDLLPEKLAFGHNTAYLYIPGKYGKETLSNNFLEKKLGIPATMRNFNTMTRLVAMSREAPEQTGKK